MHYCRERGRAFDVKEFLEAYLRRLGLKKGCCVFPKNLEKGSKVIPVTCTMMYRGFEDLKVRLNEDQKCFDLAGLSRGALSIFRSVRPQTQGHDDPRWLCPRSPCGIVHLSEEPRSGFNLLFRGPW